MCTLVILRRPGHAWPLILAANRDEMLDRPWKSPARHWPDREHVVAGLDQLAGGTWLALNDDGGVAGILNRPGSLGSAPEMRSRGELPLEAVDHAEACGAAEALGHLEAANYRPFNMVVADAIDAFWLRAERGTAHRADGIEAWSVPDELSMITAYDLNDPASPRISRYRSQFETARAPDPETGDWSEWQTLLAARGTVDESLNAMNVSEPDGFSTISSSLIALPAVDRFGVRPVWLFAAGPPDRAPYEPVEL